MRRLKALIRPLARWLPVGLAARWGVAPETDQPASGEVRAEDLRLWIRSGTHCWLGEAVAGSSDFLIPEFTLKSLHAKRDAPVQERLLSFSLVQGSTRTTIGRRALHLNGEPVKLRGPDIPVGNGKYIHHPGRYCLVASVAEQEVARFPFRVVGNQELGRQVRVHELRLQAEKLDGQRVPGLKVFRRDEHQAILVSLHVDTAILGPNTLVPCSVQTQQGTAILGREDFLLPLDRPSREVRLKRLDLDAAVFADRTKPTRYLLAAYVGGELKAVKPFLLLPSDRITNREGQLLQDAKDLPLDDLEYDQILSGLAIPPPPPPPKRLWR